jgi:tetratricopeptide (TPR) repeat protein
VRTRRAIGLSGIAAIAGCAIVIAAEVRAQDGEVEDLEGLDIGAIQQMASPGMEASPEELAAWQDAEAGRNIKARERADAIVRRNPSSYVGHFVLGFVYHYGEANFPRALFHTQRALELYTARWGRDPGPDAPWRWHARMIQELVWAHADLEHYDEQLRWMQAYNETYEPDLIAEMAWPLMKLRRFDQARQVARAAQGSGNGRQEEIALNALCAIEFEAGDDQASYRACRAAMELHGGDPRVQSAVDFTNFAEAARAVFRLDEAERVDQLATEAQTSWYGNPHVELAELYVRGGRYIEALAQLKQVPRYRDRRPPHVREADRNEARRALAEFFLVIGRTEDAIRITHRMVIAPDRRAHNSRDPQQDIAIAALLDRRARAMEADRVIVAALGAPIHERAWAWVISLGHRFDAWRSGRQAARALADDTRLVGTFMIGTSRSAVLPPWLAGELAEVLGPGVTIEALRRARAEDDREGSDAYYDAFEAEATLHGGDPERARELALRSLGALQPAEALLRARMNAIAAHAAREIGETHRALESYDQAFQADPGIFARMELAVPVRIVARGGDVASEVGSLIADSPRFDVDDVGLRIEVDADGAQGRACLLGASGSVLACAEESSRPGEAEGEFAARIATAFHAAAFAPRVDLTQADASSLDGSNTMARQPLDALFGTEGSGTDVDVLDEP